MEKVWRIQGERESVERKQKADSRQQELPEGSGFRVQKLLRRRDPYSEVVPEP
jgi:hypothetical protein